MHRVFHQITKQPFSKPHSGHSTLLTIEKLCFDEHTAVLGMSNVSISCHPPSMCHGGETGVIDSGNPSSGANGLLFPRILVQYMIASFSILSSALLCYTLTFCNTRNAQNGRGYLLSTIESERVDYSDLQKISGETCGYNKVKSFRFSEARENLALGNLVSE